jgi:hypothetical protein
MTKKIKSDVDKDIEYITSNKSWVKCPYCKEEFLKDSFKCLAALEEIKKLKKEIRALKKESLNRAWSK